MADSFRQCRIDSDCVVAPALSGLDHLPKVGESCGSECVVGIAVASQSVWAQAVRDLAPKVPCELEFEQCPPLEHWKAYCASGICTTKYQVPMPSQ